MRRLAILLLPSLVSSVEPNPPLWPPSVQVFGPETPPAEIQAAVDAAFASNGGLDNHGQFSSERFAFLFKPGQYDQDVPVGYYTQVIGLGERPWDVLFIGEKGVYSDEGSHNPGTGALDTFWRSAENFQTNAKASWRGGQGMLWAVSQGASLRRIVVSNDLILSGGGYSSGGFVANCQVSGKVDFGSQQQFFTRSSTFRETVGGVWNLVFVGVEGAPEGRCQVSGRTTVVVDNTPVIAEKPFITIKRDGTYVLNIPRASNYGAGTDFTTDSSLQVSFERVYVADPVRDSASSINAKLKEGLHVVLAPGIYYLDAPLELLIPGQVLLGLGYATLVSLHGNSVVKVGNVGGVRVAGLLLQAGPEPTQVLLEWGTEVWSRRRLQHFKAFGPGFLQDVHARVGGPLTPPWQQAEVMVRINSNNVIGDNTWLWRADHTEIGPVRDGANPCNNGLVVNGNDVIFYGLAVEHTLQDLVQWNGDYGAVYFFQSELPYDATQAFADYGFAGFRLGHSVTTFGGWGVGVYHFFRDWPVTARAGIVSRSEMVGSFEDPFTVCLSGHGVLNHIINDDGPATSKGGMVRRLCGPAWPSWPRSAGPGRPFAHLIPPSLSKGGASPWLLSFLGIVMFALCLWHRAVILRVCGQMNVIEVCGSFEVTCKLRAGALPPWLQTGLHVAWEGVRLLLWLVQLLFVSLLHLMDVVISTCTHRFAAPASPASPRGSRPQSRPPTSTTPHSRSRRAGEERPADSVATFDVLPSWPEDERPGVLPSWPEDERPGAREERGKELGGRERGEGLLEGRV